MNKETPTYAEKMRRQRFRDDMYEKCLARFLIARKMILMQQTAQAKQYLESFDDEVMLYAEHLKKRENAHDKPGLRFLVRYVFLEIRALTEKPQNGERWDMDRKYYLNQIAKFGW